MPLSIVDQHNFEVKLTWKTPAFQDFVMILAILKGFYRSNTIFWTSVKSSKEKIRMANNQATSDNADNVLQEGSEKRQGA